MGDSTHKSMGSGGGGGHSHRSSGMLSALTSDHDKIEIYKSTFHKGNIQHITMYSWFVFTSLVEIMIYHGVDLPRKLDHVLFMLSFMVEGILFYFHLHGKDLFEIHLHVLLIFAISACVLACALEMYKDRQILFTYARVAAVILQGTWFCQVGIMLYPPKPTWKWHMEEHDLLMVSTALFCWHGLLIVMGLMVQYLIVKRVYLGASDSVRARLDELIQIDHMNYNRQTSCSDDYSSPTVASLMLNSEDDEARRVMNQYNEDF